MKVWLLGQHGMLACELFPHLLNLGFDVVRTGRPAFDLCRKHLVDEAFQTIKPDLIVNAAAYTQVDQAEQEPARAFNVNRDGVKWLAQCSRDAHIPLVHISTDYVFNGKSRQPYREDDQVAPLGVYGQSKWEGEQALREVHREHLIFRTAWMFSAYGKNFLRTILRLAEGQSELRIVNDQWGCPTWAKDVSRMIGEVCQHIQAHTDGVPWGTYHFCGRGRTTWHGFAQAILHEASRFGKFPDSCLVPISGSNYPRAAERPQFSVLDCQKIQRAFGIIPDDWKSSVRECIKAIYSAPPPSLASEANNLSDM